ncbi:nucleoside diphosphate kinase 6 isoform X3 [Oryzias melastigma]|nr:nucleoside diphosphate kinase 6 isoform X3 [Oryzias melastigma]
MLLTARHLSKVLQLTLAVIKPDAMAHPLMMEMQGSGVGTAGLREVLRRAFRCAHSRCSSRFSEMSKGKLFFIHVTKSRFFYQRLVEFMSSGPMRAYILAREDAIRHWRGLMGPTKVFRARYTDPTSIRAQFGLTDTRNTTHGSDSPESAQREISFFFPDFHQADWMEKEEPLFRSGKITYDHQNQVHTLSAATQP